MARLRQYTAPMFSRRIYDLEHVSTPPPPPLAADDTAAAVFCRKTGGAISRRWPPRTDTPFSPLISRGTAAAAALLHTPVVALLQGLVIRTSEAGLLVPVVPEVVGVAVAGKEGRGLGQHRRRFRRRMVSTTSEGARSGEPGGGQPR